MNIQCPVPREALLKIHKFKVLATWSHDKSKNASELINFKTLVKLKFLLSYSVTINPHLDKMFEGTIV